MSEYFAQFGSMFLFCSETESHFVAQAKLQLTALLSQPSQRLDKGMCQHP